MIQDIGPRRFHIEYENKQPSGSEYAFCFSGRKVLVRTDGDSIAVPRCSEFRGPFRYLFRIDDEDFYLVTGNDDVPQDCSFEDVNIFRKRTSEKYMDYGGIEAYHLSVWYENSRFCGRCGHELIHSDRERMMYCPSCGAVNYPRISPCIIVAVTCGDSILLTRYAGRPKGSYALVAGFIETGETPEEAVSREVLEETGLKVRNIRYHSAQPWGYSQSLLLGYTAELDGDPAIKVDGTELSWAEWVKREDIEVRYDDFSLTNELISLFRDGKF